MLKKCSIFLILISLVVVFALPCQTLAANPGVVIDGEELSFLENPPAVVNDRILVPMWVIFEAFDMQVEWDWYSETAIAKKDGLVIRVTVGQREAFVNDEEIPLDVAARIMQGRTMVPLRFIGDAIGADVKWDSSANKAIITSPEVIEEQQLQADTSTKIYFFPVSNGESALIQMPGRNHVLIDAGGVEDGAKLVKYLQALKVDDIELLIATHPDNEHTGGINEVINNFKVEKVIDSGYVHDVWLDKAFQRMLDEVSIPREEDNQQTLSFENASIRFITGKEKWSNPLDDDAKHNPDDYSVVCMLDVDGIKALFTGDASQRLERWLTNRDVKANILKAANHGSSSSSHFTFLNNVKPEATIITPGNENRNGYPHLDTLNRVENMDSKVYRTDLQGIITVTIEEGKYQISTEK